MLDTAEHALRARLRHDLAEDHARLDEKVTRLDIASRGGFAVFVRMHHAAFDALARMTPAPDGRVSRKDLVAYRDALATDLGTLKVDPLTPLTAPEVGTMAVDHIVLGSRLGTAVLRRMWQATTDTDVAAASAYFALPLDAQRWRDHTAELQSLPGFDQRADRITEDVRELFALFEEALDAQH